MAIFYIQRICPGVLIFEGRIFCLAMLDLELPLLVWVLLLVVVLVVAVAVKRHILCTHCPRCGFQHVLFTQLESTPF